MQRTRIIKKGEEQKKVQEMGGGECKKRTDRRAIIRKCEGNIEWLSKRERDEAGDLGMEAVQHHVAALWRCLATWSGSLAKCQEVPKV